jgi:4-oxalocrotonate tautomerase
MPYVNIKIVKEGVTSKQKEKLVASISKLLNEVLNKGPQKTYAVIDGVNTDNLDVGYGTVTQIQARK